MEAVVPWEGYGVLGKPLLFATINVADSVIKQWGEYA
jgi:hypothetical protein